MKTKVSNFKVFNNETGSALLMTTVFSGILLVMISGVLSLSSQRVRDEYRRWNWTEAYYHSENALGWAAQKIADGENGGTGADFLGEYSMEQGSIGLDYLTKMSQTNEGQLENVWVTIANHPNAVKDLYLVTVSSKVGEKIRTLQGDIRKNPPSLVFDYEYFLNNWGWWWGSSITGNGDNRSNWDFDFRYNPKVNGDVRANGSITENGRPVDPLSRTPFGGMAGVNPVNHVHAGVPRVEMPNLLDFSYYEAKARQDGGKLYVGSSLKVNAVHTDASKPGMYLSGSNSSPIRIDGPVVIPGDVIISGKITGKGTLYVGGNLYIAGNTTYLNGPNFNTPPEMMGDAGRDAWVEQNLNNGKDLIAFAVREAIFAGQVNSSDWISRCYNPSGYGLRNVGDERNLGEDGITGTPDDGRAYLDTTGNGIPNSAWNDVDGDGQVDLNYNYSADIQMSSSRARKISDYPTDRRRRPLDYNNLSTSFMNRLDGIFYTNHAGAFRLGASNAEMNGALIFRDEAIIFSSTLKFNYDSRIHSRYSDDPNRFIDLGLPVANKIRIENMREIPPIAGHTTTTDATYTY